MKSRNSQVVRNGAAVIVLSLVIAVATSCKQTAAPTIPGVNVNPTPIPTAVPRMIDDFSDGNNQLSINEGRNGYWYNNNDGYGTQLPQPFAPSMPGADGTGYCIHTLGNGFIARGGGIAVNFTDPKAAYNAQTRGFNGIRFKARLGNASATSITRVYLTTMGTEPVSLGGSCGTGLTCFDYHAASVTLTTAWATYTLPFSGFLQGGWGAPVTFQADQLLGIQFQYGVNETFDFLLDDLEFVTDATPAPTATPTATQTPADTSTATPSPSLTLVPDTPTDTRTTSPSPTSTPALSNTPTISTTPSSTDTPTASSTLSNTMTLAWTSTLTETQTLTPAVTNTLTPEPPCVYSNGWFFGSSAEGWEILWTAEHPPTPSSTCVGSPPTPCFPVTYQYDPGIGDPAPGSLSVGLVFANAYQDMAVGLRLPSVNLSGRSLCARVRLDSGAGVTARIFVSSGVSYLWADGPDAVLVPGQWVNLTMDTAAPINSDVGFDPADIVQLGVDILSPGSGAATLHVDSWSYSGSPIPTPTHTPTPTACIHANGWFYGSSPEDWGILWTTDKPPTPASTCVLSPPSTCFPATVSYDAGIGDPGSGSLLVYSGFTGAYQENAIGLRRSPMDFSGRNVCARVRLDSGTGVSAKMFMNTGPSWIWGNGPIVSLVPGEWVNLSMDTSAPVYNESGFDPVSVVQLGIDLMSSVPGAVTVHIDSVSYSGAPLPTPTPCVQANGWTFDGSLQGWNNIWTSEAFPSSLAFDAAQGSPDPGSASVSLGFASVGQEASFFYQPSSIDMSYSAACASVRLDAIGAGFIQARTYVKTGSGWVWGGGPFVTLQPGVWTNISMDLSSPDSSGGGYDPSDIREVGVNLYSDGGAPAEVHIDSWTYSNPMTPTVTPTMTSTPVPGMIDDLEDGDPFIIVQEGRDGGGWYTYEDPSAGCTHSAVADLVVSGDGANGTQRSARFTGTGCSLWGAGVALSMFTSPVSVYDAAARGYTGVKFWAKDGTGSNRELFVECASSGTWPASIGGTCLSGCQDHYRAPVTLGIFWQQYTVFFSQMSQEGWGSAVPFDATGLGSVEFRLFPGTPAGSPFDISVDEISFTSDTPPPTFTPTPTYSGSPDTVDDLEDGDTQIITQGGRWGSWWPFYNSTESSAVMSADSPGFSSNYCAHVTGNIVTIGGSLFPVAGLTCPFNSGVGSYSIPASYTGVAFDIKASTTGSCMAPPLEFNISDTTTWASGDFNANHIPVLQDQWTAVTVFFNQMTTGGFAYDRSHPLDTGSVKFMSWRMFDAGVDYDLSVDNVALITTAPPSATPAYPPALVDDMESGPYNLILLNGGRNGHWWSSETNNPSNPTNTLCPVPFYASSGGSPASPLYASRVSGVKGPGDTYDPTLALEFMWAVNGYLIPYDIQASPGGPYAGVQFYAKVGSSSTNTIHVTMPDATTDPTIQSPNCGTWCYAHHQSPDLILTTDWALYQVPFSSMTNPWGGNPATTIDPTSAIGIQWQVATSGDYDLWVDDVSFY